jgi:hypothetical protein
VNAATLARTGRSVGAGAVSVLEVAQVAQRPTQGFSELEAVGYLFVSVRTLVSYMRDGVCPLLLRLRAWWVARVSV